MAALTADRKFPDTKQIQPQLGGYVIDYAVAASTIIYEGGFVVIDAGGNIEPCGTRTNTEPCLGVAIQSADNSSGADSDITCKVLVGGMIVHDVTSTTIANIGDAVYCADDQTLNLTDTTNERFGMIVDFISGDSCVVLHNPWPVFA